MKKNMGTFDRVLRTLFAVIIGALYLSDAISGTVGIALGILAAIFLVTGLVGFCPLYAPFKFATKKVTEEGR